MGAAADNIIDSSIVLRDDDGITTLTLNRPAQHNALSADMLAVLQTVPSTRRCACC
jgi:enoyl-CoA hydratase/carnithine racemase